MIFESEAPMNLLLIALLTCAVEPAESGRPVFEGKFQKARDKLEVSYPKGAVLWKITSKNGVGTAVVTLKKGKAPAKVTILFAGLRKMESLHLINGPIGLIGRPGKSGTKSISTKDILLKGKRVAARLTVERTKEGIEVVLTYEKGEPDNTWSLSWIATYRP